MKEYILDGNLINSLQDLGIEIATMAEEGPISEGMRLSIEATKKNYTGDNFTNIDRMRDWIGFLILKDPNVVNWETAEPTILRIKNVKRLKEILGYEATTKKLETVIERYKKLYPDDAKGLQTMQDKIEMARQYKGETIFDWLSLQETSATGSPDYGELLQIIHE